MQTTLERLQNLLVEQLGVDLESVTPEARIVEDLGADSLDTVEIVMAVEEEWNLEIPDEDAEQVRTVAQAVELIDRLLPSEKGKQP